MDEQHVIICDEDKLDSLKRCKGIKWDDGYGIATFDDLMTYPIDSMVIDGFYGDRMEHRNHCFWDSRIDNLCPGSTSDETYCDMNQNKLSGIQYMPMFKKWFATIIKNDKFILLGLYDTMYEACVTFSEAESLRNNEYERVFGDEYSLSERIHGRMTTFHSRYFLNMDGLFFGLPSWYSIAERNNLVDILTQSRKDLFEYHLQRAKNDTSPYDIEKRLNILASYIIELYSEKTENNTMTKYKYDIVYKNEIPMSSTTAQFSLKTNENIKKIIK